MGSVAALLNHRWTRRGSLILALALLGYAAITQGSSVTQQLEEVGWARLVAAQLAVLAGLTASMLAWRVIAAGLGGAMAPPVAARIFFVGQLGKYVPGSVWPVVAQIEMARAAGVRRSAIGTAAVTVMILNVTTGAVLGACLLPFISGDERWLPALFAVCLLGAVALHPRVMARAARRVARLLRREPPDIELSGRTIATATVWTMVMWGLYGLHLHLLLGDVGSRVATSYAVSVTGFALAWTVGFLAIIAPAGAGAREAALVLALLPIVPASGGTAAALLSRLLMTLGDAILGLIGLRLGRAARAPAADDRSAE